MAIFKAPRITTAQRQTLLLEASEIVYDTDKNNFYGGNGILIGGFPLGAGSSISQSDYVVEAITINSTHIVNKKIYLQATPFGSNSVTLTFANGIEQLKGVDFIVNANAIEWDGLGLDGFIEEGDIVIVEYMIFETPGCTVQEITLTQQDIDNKQVVLLHTPKNASAVTLSISGGISQLNGEDFIVNAGILSWSGLGLDGFLEKDDVLIVQY